MDIASGAGVRAVFPPVCAFMLTYTEGSIDQDKPAQVHCETCAEDYCVSQSDIEKAGQSRFGGSCEAKRE